MEGIRISVQFKLRQPFFFSENYKEHINRFLIESGVKHFVFSDLLCIKQKKLNDGFYGLNKGRFDIATFINGDVIDLVGKFSKKDMDFGNGTLPLSKINLSGIGYFSEGYMLSPVLVLDDKGESIDYFKNPVMFSESIRKKLITKYLDVFRNVPQDDSFIFIFSSTPEIINCKFGVCFKGKFQLYGSKELIRLSNILGLGDKNEYGFGMTSRDLYFFKKKISSQAI